jgi:hypothetical protein
MFEGKVPTEILGLMMDEVAGSAGIARLKDRNLL